MQGVGVGEGYIPTDSRTDGWTERQTDGRTDRRQEMCNALTPVPNEMRRGGLWGWRRAPGRTRLSGGGWTATAPGRIPTLPILLLTISSKLLFAYKIIPRTPRNAGMEIYILHGRPSAMPWKICREPSHITGLPIPDRDLSSPSPSRYSTRSVSQCRERESVQVNFKPRSGVDGEAANS